MPSAVNLGQVQMRLEAVESIDKMDEAARELIALYQQLSKAQTGTNGDGDLKTLAGLELAYHRRARPVANYWQAFSADRLDDFARGKRPTPENFAQWVQETRQALDWSVELLPERRTQEQVQVLYKKLGPIEGDLAGIQRLGEIKAEVEKLSGQADGIEAANPSRAVDYAKRAVIVVESAETAGWSEETLDAWEHLKSKALRRRDDLRERHEVPVTKTQGDDYVRVIIDFAARTKEKPEELVTYFSDESLGAIGVTMTVERALGIAKLRLFAFWREKIHEYIADAKKNLAENRPEDAQTALVQYQKLPGLYDDRVGIKLANDQLVVINQVESAIKPQLEAKTMAEGLVRQARSADNVINGFESYRLALKTFPLARLEETYLELVGKARVELKRQLQQAEDKLKGGIWDLAGTRLQEAQKLLEQSQDLRQECQDRYDTLNSLYLVVAPLSPNSPTPLSHQQELGLLVKLRDAYRSSYWAGWSELQKRLTDLEARRSVLDLIQEATAACKPDARPGTLIDLERQCIEIRDQPPAPLNPDQVRNLNAAIKKLGAWIGYAHARDELGKLESMPTLKETDDEQDDAFEPPDLEVVERALARVNADPVAMDAVQARGLRRELETLKRRDTSTLKTIEEFEALDESTELETWRTALTNVNKALKKPTSHRTRLLRLRREIQLTLSEKIEEAVQSVLDRTRRDGYKGLDYARVRDLLGVYARLRLEEPVAMKIADAPLKAAQAHELEADVQKGDLAGQTYQEAWNRIKVAWYSVAEAAGDERNIETNDRNLRDLAQRRALLASKQVEFHRAQNEPDDAVAEKILARLQTEGSLQEDWQVWFRHGAHCFKIVRAQLDRDEPPSEYRSIQHYLGLARESLNRADKLSASPPATLADHAAVLSELRTLDPWDKLTQTGQRLQSLLDIGERSLASHACLEAQQSFDKTMQQLAEGKPRELLDRIWQAYSNGAGDKLRQQMEDAQTQSDPTDAVFQQLDYLLGLIALFPQDRAVRVRLDNVVGDALHGVQSEVNQVIEDYNGRKYLERSAKLAQETDDKQIARGQLFVAGTVQQRLNQLESALKMVPSGAGADGNLANEINLNGWREALRKWLEELETFQERGNQAIALAQRGLREPRQFESARYILHKGGARAPRLLQIPDGFVGNGHPTFHWWLEELEERERRRSRQEQALFRIQVCLKYEGVVQPQDLPQNLADPVEHRIVQDLRRKLEAPVHRSFPVEEALQVMVEMRQQEPGDACGLQATLTYNDPDDYGRSYQSLDAIRPVIENKVNQVRLLRQWLNKFLLGANRVVDGNPGYVDWKSRRTLIEKHGDTSYDGLVRAARECVLVREGDKDGLVHGRWSLEKTAAALEHTVMLQTLDILTGDEGRPKGVPVLCKPALSVDQEREELRQQILAEIQDCRRLETTLRLRLTNFHVRWEDYQLAHIALVRLKKNWASRQEWLVYQQRAEAFCEICPGYIEFQNSLREVQEITGLRPPCLKSNATD